MQYSPSAPLGSSIQTAEIDDGSITNAKLTNTTILNSKINASAAIDYSKLAALTSANLLIGSAGNVATVTAITGDVTITNGGVTAIGASKVTEAMIANDAIGLPELKAGTDGELITWDASGDPAAVAVGNANEILTSNGAGAAPTFQAAASGGMWTNQDTNTFSAATTDSFTSLPSKNLWLVVGYFENIHTSNISVTLELNADTTTTNYNNLAQDGATTTTANTTPYVGLNINASERVPFMFTFCGTPSGGDVMISFLQSSFQGSNTTFYTTHSGAWNAASGDITSILIRSTVANKMTGKWAIYYAADI